MSKIISPDGHIGTLDYIKSIWVARHLCIALAKGEIKNQSSMNITGIFLNIIQSLIGLAIYWIVFGLAIGIDTGEIPYPIFVLHGIFIWHYFSATTGYCSNCFIINQNLIEKLYFPRNISSLTYSKSQLSHLAIVFSLERRFMWEISINLMLQCVIESCSHQVIHRSLMS